MTPKSFPGNSLMIRRMLVAIILFTFGPSAVAAQLLPQFRISLENTATHFQTQAVKRFADELTHRLASHIDVQFYADAQLFRDSDVIQALAQGKVEMAVPGTWHVMRFEPSVGVFLLPVFYGRSAQTNYRILDSAIGETINRRIETALKFKVLGSWMDLGHAHLFGVNQNIERHADIRGLRVRVAGGIANMLRIQALGASPSIIPWPDLPGYMQQGRIDAVLTSYETVKSAQLWKDGIQSVFEDQEYFPQYIPLVRASFWNRLPRKIQQVLTDTWADHVDGSRKMAADAQKQAKQILIQNGVTVFTPAPGQLEIQRRQLLRHQDAFIQKLGIDPALADQINEALDSHE